MSEKIKKLGWCFARSGVEDGEPLNQKDHPSKIKFTKKRSWNKLNILLLNKSKICSAPPTLLKNPENASFKKTYRNYQGPPLTPGHCFGHEWKKSILFYLLENAIGLSGCGLNYYWRHSIVFLNLPHHSQLAPEKPYQRSPDPAPSLSCTIQIAVATTSCQWLPCSFASMLHWFRPFLFFNQSVLIFERNIKLYNIINLKRPKR